MQMHLLFALLLRNLDLEFALIVQAVLEGSDLEKARISQVIVPLDFKLTELLHFELVDLVGLWVLWLKNVNE